tara:strand:+ start:1501 stop:1782 length:282 start_codon:yes stop_codon:yes gene_type:complete
MSEEEKTDKEVYDMAEHLKSLYDAKESELEKLKEQNITLKKVIMSAYGSIRLLDQNFCNILLDEQANRFIIESLRSYLSDIVEYEILHIEDIL